MKEDLYTGIILNNRYVIERELGRGGIGVVYLARDKQLLSKPVVVKALLECSAQDEWIKNKFQQEIEALARIDHPGIVGVLDSGETADGKPYFVMQYVEGVTLRSQIKAGGIDLDRLARIIRQIGHALTAAHDKGICHRDLKPENIMLQPLDETQEQVKIIDFGVARVENSQLSAITTGKMLVGTFEYMAPEQLASKQMTALCDIYSLGVIAYEAATGRRPFNIDSPFLLLDAQREGVKIKPKALRSDLPEAAQEAILKALSFEPEDRYKRAKDFGEELSKALTALPAAKAARTDTRIVAKFKSDNSQKRRIAADERFSTTARTTPAMPKYRTPKTDANLTKKLEPVGGAVPLDSHFYIVRSTDEEFCTAIARSDSIVLVKGARQIGKTSLLARGLQQARSDGAKVVLTDFQRLSAEDFAASESLFLALGNLIAEQLDLDVFPKSLWKSDNSPTINFERYVRREALNKAATPIVWGMDEVDRLFTCSFGSEVFGLFRSWHNARSLDPDAPWRRLTLAIAYATEAHLFISDMNQSPFNVGTRLALEDFNSDQLAELNSRYGSPLKNSSELERFYLLVGGHPYLARRGLHEMVVHNIEISALEAIAERDEGPFGDHLRRMQVLLSHDATLCEAVRAVLQGRDCHDMESFYRLRSAGIMSGESILNMKPRCRLYERYLQKHLQ